MANIVKEYKQIRDEAKLNAEYVMDDKQNKLCKGIILTTVAAATGADVLSFAPTNAIPVTAAQITMTIALAKVFNISINKSAAKEIISDVAKPLLVRAAANPVIKFVPLVGTGVSATITAFVTEAVGWIIASRFAKEDYLKVFDTENEESNDTDDEYDNEIIDTIPLKDSQDIEKDSFFALSDFHANEWPLKKITKYYLNEVDKVFILGDATDRGPDENGKGGIDILCQIKELTEQFNERVFYIPGNHDLLLYNFAKHNDLNALELLLHNGGSQTVNEIKRLKKKQPSSADELLDWLGNLPIQRTHVFEGQKYVFAHAFFNQTLYDKYPQFGLKDMFDEKISGLYKDKARHYIWFRKAIHDYDPDDVPDNDVIIVIGHTPLGAYDDLDLENADGETVSVVCVDGGITFAGQMIKFNGKDLLSTAPDSHKFKR